MLVRWQFFLSVTYIPWLLHICYIGSLNATIYQERKSWMSLVVLAMIIAQDESWCLFHGLSKKWHDSVHHYILGCLPQNSFGGVIFPCCWPKDKLVLFGSGFYICRTVRTLPIALLAPFTNKWEGILSWSPARHSFVTMWLLLLIWLLYGVKNSWFIVCNCFCLYATEGILSQPPSTPFICNDVSFASHLIIVWSQDFLY